jgi:surfactin synthase thioesterase subunit
VVQTFTTAYLPFPAAAESARTKLFCFHHAGGTASTFRTWQRALGPAVAVLPVQLPGRERRAAEPRFTDLAALVADLDDHLDPVLDRPYAFYGHSMGAAVAYRLAVRRAATDRSLPQRLLVGAYPPPHVAAPVTQALRLSDDQLARWLVDIGGMSELILRYPEWVRAALAVLRDDLRVCQHDPPAGDRPLRCPIDAFVGADDPLLAPAEMAGWARHTSAGCQVHTMPGGHFFIHDSPAAFLPALSAALHPH